MAQDQAVVARRIRNDAEHQANGATQYTMSFTKRFEHDGKTRLAYNKRRSEEFKHANDAGRSWIV